MNLGPGELAGAAVTMVEGLGVETQGTGSCELNESFADGLLGGKGCARKVLVFVLDSAAGGAMGPRWPAGHHLH